MKKSIAPSRTSPADVAADMNRNALLSVRDLDFSYHQGRRSDAPKALDRVSFDLRAGETLAVVGESGSGKSTLARAVVQQVQPHHGSVQFRGRELTGVSRPELREVRRGISMVFQDSFAALDPRWTITDLVAEPLRNRAISKSAARSRAEELLEFVGLDVGMSRRERASRLSGGQCQRVAIARALAGDPQLLIADEPVSALDVSVQAQVLNLLIKIQEEFGVAIMFISHDLSVVAHVSHRILVLFRGRTCEVGPTDQVMTDPKHPYTAGLLASVRMPPSDGRLAHLRPRPVEMFQGERSEGCHYRGYCPVIGEGCVTERPGLVASSPGHDAACHHPVDRRLS